MRRVSLPTTLRHRVHRGAPWIALLLLLPVAIAQGQMTPGGVAQEPTSAVLTPQSPPEFLEPLRERFFPPIAVSGRERLALTPFVSVGERYDDNIFLTESNTASDFVTIAAGGIRLRYLPARETTLELDYRIDGEIFADHADQNAVSHQGALRFASQLSRSLSVNVRDTLISTTEPLQNFIGITEATGLRNISQQRRARTFRNTAGAAAEIRVGARVTIDPAFEYSIYDINLPQELDETRYTVGAEVGYLTDVGRKSKAYISYMATFFLFDQNGRPVVNVPSADFRVHTAMAGFRHYFSPTLSGNAALGYARTHSDDPAQDDLGTIAANLNLTNQIRDGQVSFGYSRNLTSGGGIGGVVREDALIATFFWKATPKVTTLFAGKYALFDFLGIPVVGQATTSSFWSLRPGLAYQILPLWNLALYYTYEFTNFDAPNPNVHDQRVTLISQLALRTNIFLHLTYDYSVRHLQGATVNTLGLQEFNRNQVMLLLTYAPTFRF